MDLRKFEVIKVILHPGMPGPDRLWKVYYKAIKNKLWIEDTLWIVAKNEPEAKHKAEQRFGGKD